MCLFVFAAAAVCVSVCARVRACVRVCLKNHLAEL